MSPDQANFSHDPGDTLLTNEAVRKASGDAKHDVSRWRHQPWSASARPFPSPTLRWSTCGEAGSVTVARHAVRLRTKVIRRREIVLDSSWPVPIVQLAQ